MAFDLGGKVSGQSISTSTQSGTITYIPSSTTAPPPLVSDYPAGAGLATLNTAYPGSAANPVASTGLVSTLTTDLGTGSDTVTILLLLALAAGAWLIYKGKL